MMDLSTVVCYLRSDTPSYLPRFGKVQWNNKKWRCLLFVECARFNALFAGRQYPFYSQTALELMREHFLPLISEDVDNWSNWTCSQVTEVNIDYIDGQSDTCISINPAVCLAGRLYQLQDLVGNRKDSLNFNDLTSSSCYTPYYCWNHRGYARRLKFSIGSEVPCVCCGLPVHHTDMMIDGDCYERFQERPEPSNIFDEGLLDDLPF